MVRVKYIQQAIIFASLLFFSEQGWASYHGPSLDFGGSNSLSDSDCAPPKIKKGEACVDPQTASSADLTEIPNLEQLPKETTELIRERAAEIFNDPKSSQEEKDQAFELLLKLQDREQEDPLKPVEDVKGRDIPTPNAIKPVPLSPGVVKVLPGIKAVPATPIQGPALPPNNPYMDTIAETTAGFGSTPEGKSYRQLVNAMEAKLPNISATSHNPPATPTESPAQVAASPTAPSPSKPIAASSSTAPTPSSPSGSGTAIPTPTDSFKGLPSPSLASGSTTPPPISGTLRHGGSNPAAGSPNPSRAQIPSLTTNDLPKELPPESLNKALSGLSKPSLAASSADMRTQETGVKIQQPAAVETQKNAGPSQEGAQVATNIKGPRRPYALNDNSPVTKSVTEPKGYKTNDAMIKGSNSTGSASGSGTGSSNVATTSSDNSFSQNAGSAIDSKSQSPAKPPTSKTNNSAGVSFDGIDSNTNGVEQPSVEISKSSQSEKSIPKTTYAIQAEALKANLKELFVSEPPIQRPKTPQEKSTSGLKRDLEALAAGGGEATSETIPNETSSASNQITALSKATVAVTSPSRELAGQKVVQPTKKPETRGLFGVLGDKLDTLATQFKKLLWN